MKSVIAIPRPTRLFATRSVDSFCRKKLYEKLALIREGSIEMISPDGERSHFGDVAAPSHLRSSVTIRASRAYSRIALGGSVGTGESYVDGDWDCTNLVALVRTFVLNREVLNDLDSGTGAFFQPLQKFLHHLRANSEGQARKNIQAHYDLGNDFFSLFLDETWMYSSGFFKNASSTLREAQVEKNDRICRRLNLNSSHHLLEIGTGWGGFAIHAVKNYGCHVTTTTISKEQFEFAAARVKEEGLEDKITLLFQDYRTLEGKYDRLVSIEMVEAVGVKFLDTYFEKCSSLLKPDGVMGLQGILIQDQFFEQAARSVDFIQTHIFPGSAIPSVARITDAIKNHTDMRLEHLEDFGLHYARTLSAWAKNLDRNQSEIARMGYPDSLRRLWNYYFAYCEGGFEERQISVGQFFFTKPRFRGELNAVSNGVVG